MSVYFVYRTTYDAPLEKHVRRFDDDSVLAWARRIWRPIADRDQASEYAEQLLGGLDVYSFGSFFAGIAEDGTPPPKSMKDVVAGLRHMYVGEIKHGRHHVQLLTDDDETEMAFYLFDDHYRAASPGKADWLLHEGWELPAGDADGPAGPLPRTRRMKPAGDGEGRLYPICLYAPDSGNLDGLSAPLPRLDGVRLDGLCRLLLMHPEEEYLDFNLTFLREEVQQLLARPRGPDAGFLRAIRAEPAERTHWAAYSDWLTERDRPPAGLHLLDRALRRAGPDSAHKNRDPKRDLTHVTAHVAQAARHEGSWPDDSFLCFTPHHTYQTWIFFDDRWAAARPALAQGLVRFATRWDVL